MNSAIGKRKKHDIHSTRVFLMAMYQWMEIDGKCLESGGKFLEPRP